jgi:hypothetical protein
VSSRLVGMVLENYPSGGNELLLAIALADEADHSGGHIRGGVALLARLSRQTENNVRRLLRKMEEGGWLECMERSSGGRGKPSLYCINPDWVRLPTGWQAKPSKPPKHPNDLGVSGPAKPPNDLGVCDVAPLSLKTLPPIVPQLPETIDGSAVPSAVEGDEAAAFDAAEDARLARWMFEKIRELHPKHREPNWRRWCRSIRLTRTVDSRTHREIAALFAWANADREPRPGSTFCWATVILSPDKLRTQWDRLEIARRAATPAKPAAPDSRCSECHERPWSVQLGKSGPHVCRQCAAALEAA